MGKGTKSIAFYLMMILVFGSLMYFIVKEGESQQVGTAVQTMQNAPQTMGEGFLVFWDSVTHHIQSSMGILLLQIITILIVCRLFGWMFQKIGQPPSSVNRSRYRTRSVRARPSSAGGICVSFSTRVIR